MAIDSIYEKLDSEINGISAPWLTLLLVAGLFLGLATVGASISTRVGGRVGR